MLGLMVLVGLILYILLSRFIVKSTYKKTGSLIKKRIALIIMILIPTWDIIIGYPIFWYLCTFESGMKIYKTVDNVEGFYIGRQSGQIEPLMPYKKYRYIDYQLSSDDKYYRSYWLKNNISELCIKPKNRTWYVKEFQNGRCLAREELQIDLLSQFELKGSNERRKWKHILPLLGIYKNPNQIINRKTKQVLGEQVIYNWNQGWLNTFLTDGMSVSSCRFNGEKNTFQNTLELTLKPALRAKNDNNI